MRLDQRGLLEKLHEGVHQQPLWRDFLEALRAQTRSTTTSIAFYPPGEEAIVELVGGLGESSDLAWQYLMKSTRDYPARHQMREGRVYSLDELLALNDPTQRAISISRLEALGVTNMRSVRVTEQSGVEVWLSCSGGATIGSATGALLTAIAPHLRIALRGFIALSREQYRVSVTADAFRRMNFGWLLLDERCRVVDATSHVEQMLQRSQVLRRGPYDRLTPASATLDRELMALVKRFARETDNRPQAFNLSRDPLIDMLVAPAPAYAISHAARPIAIVYLRGDRLSQAERREQLQHLFGLLPSEARLAWVLAQGMTIAEAAQSLGLTLETARNYSKKIYAKTGARGQAELVRIVLTSALAIM